MVMRHPLTAEVVKLLSKVSPKYAESTSQFVKENFEQIARDNPELAKDLYFALEMGAAAGAGAVIGDTLNGTDIGEQATNLALTALPVGGAVAGYMISDKTDSPEAYARREMAEYKKGMPEAIKQRGQAAVGAEFADLKNNLIDRGRVRGRSRNALGTVAGGAIGGTLAGLLMRDGSEG